MTTILSQGHVSDGYDVAVILDSGERRTLHFAQEPSAAVLTDTIADIQAQAQQAAQPQFVITSEDGTVLYV